ncbi:MAG: Hfq-like protein [Candidatus Korobacteraceae bacterium]|jgi:sRNA-binding regulator protein Hfq
MKDSMDSTSLGRVVDHEAFANRKLIRPAFNRNDHSRHDGDHRRDGDRRERNDRPMNGGKKLPPPEQTHAENFYYQKQMQAHTPMVLVLQDGEEIHGTIEWYDKYCLKVNRPGASNLLIYKPSIKYLYKESEAGE